MRLQCASSSFSGLLRAPDTRYGSGLCCWWSACLYCSCSFSLILRLHDCVLMRATRRRQRRGEALPVNRNTEDVRAAETVLAGLPARLRLQLLIQRTCFCSLTKRERTGNQPTTKARECLSPDNIQVEDYEVRKQEVSIRQ